MLCPNCKYPNPDEADFCMKCTTPLRAASPGSATAATGGVAANNESVGVGGNVGGHVVIAKDGAQVFIGEQPITMTAVQRESALGRYLSHVISRTRYLQLQGIRSGGKLVNIELESIYITLKATRTRTAQAEDEWLKAERELAPGERDARPAPIETVTVKVEEALAANPRLVILGDPGSGKTTLLRYLALRYARDRAEGAQTVSHWLGQPESGHVPILLPLRNLGAYLTAHYPQDDGTEGHARLLEFLRAHLKGERMEAPDDFFDADLRAGRVVILLDGMDEVGHEDLRRRMARLIDAFAAAYPACRVVVTSRVVGYAGAARLGEGFATTTVRDFTLADVEQFLTHWHRLIAVGQMGVGESAEHFAAAQTAQLMTAIKANLRVRELAINPLMLTVIALVHRDRVKLPDRRAELYAEAVDVLLGKWDEARGVEELRVLEDRAYDAGDRRLLLQSLALKMHEAQKREIEAEDLLQELRAAFAGVTPTKAAAVRAAHRFLQVIQERTGLLVEAGPGTYRFSHLTFQEYLAAVEMAERDDYVAYTLAHVAEAWWREAILLEAGYLSTKKIAKVTGLIRAIADCPTEPELFHNLVLAAECLRDVGPTRIEADLATALQMRLKRELEQPIPDVSRGALSFVSRVTGATEKRKAVFARRIAAANALGRIESGSFGTGGQYWTLPHEPKWAAVPAGEFWMGSERGDNKEKPIHRVFVAEFQMAYTPVTNAQYWLFVSTSGAHPPMGWEDDLPPKGKENHPVVSVSWHDARQYCEWLSRVTGKTIRLPTEAEWEKAARGPSTGSGDKRLRAWGDEHDPSKANVGDTGIGRTSAVGLFPAGKSPYGCLDMIGNVWEWTQSKFMKYPYKADDGREDVQGNDSRVLRGGSFINNRRRARCAFRYYYLPVNGLVNLGFRVVVSPGSRS